LRLTRRRFCARCGWWVAPRSPALSLSHSPPPCPTHNFPHTQNRDLQGLYDQLVGAGVLSDAEFWRGRQDAVRAKMAAAGAAAGGATGGRQRLGLASALLTEGGPALDGAGPAGNGPSSSSSATFRLTPELVHQIFAEKPYVRSAYAAAVPRSVDEATFWKRYLKFEAARRARRKARAEGAPLAGLPPEDELFRQFRDEARAAARGADAAAVRAQRVDPAVDLAAAAADDRAALPGFGFAHAPGSDPVSARGVVHDPRDGLAAELNRHAGVVLGGVPADLPEDTAAAARALKGAAPVRGRATGAVARGPGGGAGDGQAPPLAPSARATTPDEATAALWRARAGSDLADLRSDPAPAYQALAVADPRGYFTAAPGGADASTAAKAGPPPPPTPPGSLLEAMRALADPAGRETATALAGAALMRPGAALATLREAAGEGAAVEAADAALLIGGAAVAGTHADPAVALSPALQAVLRQTVLAVNELLRHLWGALPATTPGRASRVERVVAALRAQGARVQALQDAAHGAEKVHVMRVMKPVEEALALAFKRVEGGGGGSGGGSGGGGGSGVQVVV
jgi:transcription initiation factor TFIIH subunit 1